MFHVVLYQPEIPPNTGNIIRLCANTGAHLHLIRPLGFVLSDKTLRRAGLDYDVLATLQTWSTWEDCYASIQAERWFAISTRGCMCYDQPRFVPGDVFVFGPETRGLPQELLESCPEERRLRIPMQGSSRSLNLANAAAVILYEAWRQLNFA